LLRQPTPPFSLAAIFLSRQRYAVRLETPRSQAVSTGSRRSFQKIRRALSLDEHIGLSGEQPPAILLQLPNLEDADRGDAGFAFGRIILRIESLTDDRIVADRIDRLIGKDGRFERIGAIERAGEFVT
jgi:hypothetical protein